ncbi:MAG: DegV family EDD domain-containing protein [Chloroflexi bacterium]|nr:DegV family EDD domain-containing protein [Chloroflexota bacterium]
MGVRVITDSGSDITQEEAKRLGITVIPVYLRFGDEVYRDGVDINCDEFYHKLATSPIHPSTAAPSPGDFAEAYEQAAQEADEIVSIHITRRHSATYDAALVGKETAEKKHTIWLKVNSLCRSFLFSPIGGQAPASSFPVPSLAVRYGLLFHETHHTHSGLARWAGAPCLSTGSLFRVPKKRDGISLPA